MKMKNPDRFYWDLLNVSLLHLLSSHTRYSALVLLFF